MKSLNTKPKYEKLLADIGSTIERARENAIRAVNIKLVKVNRETGRRNVLDMRRFYLAYSKWQAVPAKLSWIHFVVLLGVSDETAGKFYEKQAIHEN